jgi:GDSL-like Lipase/Acylhydrolase family
VNVGVPGMSTGQVLERLPDLVRRYEPDLILVWAGVNNSWNRAGERGEHSELAVRLDRLAAHTRVYRLARTWLHDRRLDRDRAVHDQRRAWEVLDPQNALRGEGAFTVRREDGVIETMEHDRDEQTPADAVWQQRTERDYAAIARYARAAGLPVAFIGYPLGEIGVAAVVNRALRNVAQAEDVPVVDAAASALRIPFEERHFLWAGHPDGRMYGEIARDVLPVVLRSLPPEG